MREVDLDKQVTYAVEDTDITIQLKKIFEKNLTNLLIERIKPIQNS